MATQPKKQSPTEPILSGFRGIEDINLNGLQNYWGQDGSFNLGGGGQGGAPSQIPTNILQPFPQLAGIMQQYGASGPVSTADLRSPAVSVPAPVAATPPPATGSGKGAGGKSPKGQNITGEQWNPSSSPNIMELIKSKMASPAR
jgi:hypothetical protein